MRQIAVETVFAKRTRQPAGKILETDEESGRFLSGKRGSGGVAAQKHSPQPTFRIISVGKGKEESRIAFHVS
jgi:hypothetical protein